MKPSVGRVVHYYQNDNRVPFVAFITATLLDEDGELDKDFVDLYVISPARPFYKVGVKFSKEPERNHWTWPPKV